MQRRRIEKKTKLREKGTHGKTELLGNYSNYHILARTVVVSRSKGTLEPVYLCWPWFAPFIGKSQVAAAASPSPRFFSVLTRGTILYQRTPNEAVATRLGVGCQALWETAAKNVIFLTLSPPAIMRGYHLPV